MDPATAWVMDHVLTPHIRLEDHHFRAATQALRGISEEEPDDVVDLHGRMQQALNLFILVVLDRGWMTL